MAEEIRKTRREEILEAAERHFARRGFRKTRLEEVAADLGMVKSALYKHFRSKEALFDAVVDGMARRSIEVMEEAQRRGRTAEGKLRLNFLRLFDFVYDRVVDWGISAEGYYEMLPRINQALAVHQRSLIETFRRIIEDGNQRGELCCRDPEAAAVCLHWVLDGLVDWLVRREITRDQGRRHIESLMAMLMGGIRREA